jgi:hypothetical protein
VPPFPEEEEYAPPSDSNDDDMSDVIDEEAEAQKSEEDRERAAEEREEKRMRKKAKRDSARKALDKLTAKLRELAFEARRKEVAQITKDHKLIYPMLWVKLSAASQSKVREDPEFKTAKENLDCILLWEIIRKSHHTHTFEIGDPMIGCQ